ncbi:MAG TPA: hypothetical protein DCP90_00940 [Clostridiales bacterium]|nr:MAG: hypothetical protein A2Y22_07805 [Clostridiales bacterium GWD2_32_59]HAN09162.1 hypothetical protein [Clostridiales bacterium]
MNKYLSSILVLVILFNSVYIKTYAFAGQDVAVGEYIQLGKYNDQPILWRVINKQDVNNDGVEELMLFSDKILSLKPFDALGDNVDYDLDGVEDTYTVHRSDWGSNYWDRSSIKEWLNSPETSVSYTQAQVPDRDHVKNYTSAEGGQDEVIGENAYSTEKGFLAEGNFTSDERNIIKPVTHRTLIAEVDNNYTGKTVTGNSYLPDAVGDTPDMWAANFDDYYGINVQDKVFFLSIWELNEYVYSASTGLTHPISGDNYFLAYPTPQAVDKSEYPIGISDYHAYWLGTPFTQFDNSSVYAVYPDNGTLTNTHFEAPGAWRGYYGIRPAMFISSDVVLSGTGTNIDPYKITSYGVPQYPVGVTSNDRKYFRYFLGLDNNNNARVMLVAPANEDSTVKQIFNRNDILDPVTHKYKQGIYYIIDNKGIINVY